MIVTEPESAAASGPSADAWFTPGRFAALLALLIAATFPGILLGRETFIFRDFGLFGYPLAYYQRECFWRGELPLWNPLNFCGLPFLAQWNTLTLYPPALFYLLFPLSWSLGVFNLAHLFFAGLGMFYLARHWTRNSLAAAVAGTVFAFNGLSWHSLMWPNDIAGLAWMPWVVLTVERAWREGGHRIALAVLAGALQMLTGAPEIIALTWALLAAIWAAQYYSGKIPRRQMSILASFTVLFVTGLSAAQLLPFLQLLRHSHRDASFNGSTWAMPLAGLANFLAPLFHTHAARLGVFVQYGQTWTSSYYLGAGVMALVLAAAWRSRDRRFWLLAVAAALSVWIALGDRAYLYSTLRAALPLLTFMRYPIKFVVLAVFILPILAAYAISAQPPTSGLKPLRNSSLVLLAAFALLAWVEHEYPGDQDDWPAIWPNILSRAAFVVLVPVALLLLRRATNLKIQIALQFVLITLLWLDVLTHAPNLSPTVARSVFAPNRSRAELHLDPAPRAGEPRFMETQSAMDTLHATTFGDAATDFLRRREALYDDCNLLDGVPKTDGLYSLYLRETVQALSLLYVSEEKNIDLKGLKDFLGIKYLNQPYTDPAQPLAWAARDSFLPLVTAGQQPVFADDNKTALGLLATDFDPREIVYLPLEAEPFTSAQRGPAKIISQQISAEHLELEIEAPAPAMLVIAQSFYAPWHAYVDGRRVDLWRANHAFQALQVPTGHHQVKLAYEDRAFQSGAAISLLTLAALAVFWFSQRRPQ